MVKALKKIKRKDKGKAESDFSAVDKVLITAASVVAFGGFIFCTIMIVLMRSIDY